MQWTSEKCLSEERISYPGKSVWQDGVFRYQVHEWTKTLQRFSNTRLRIDLYSKGNLQRHKYNNLDRETCTDICSHFFKLCGRANLSLQIWSSSPRCTFYWSSWKISFPTSKAKMKNWFLDIETTIKIKLGSILEKLTQGHNRRKSARFDMSQGDCDTEICASSQFLQLPKKSISWSSRNSGTPLQCFACVWIQQCKKRSTPIKSYSLPILVNELDIDTTVMKKANQVISFKSVDNQLLDIINFLGGAKSLDSFLKAYKNFRNTRLFPVRMVWSPWQNSEYRTSPIWRLLQ